MIVNKENVCKMRVINHKYPKIILHKNILNLVFGYDVKE